ncbi:MAG: YlbF family regulator [Lachnospiraceae bacterium]|nr:YlbF family regulator [Lachnospiraceae bacterium]
MRDVIRQSKELNEKIKQSEEYRIYIETKTALYEHDDLCIRLKEFKNRNESLQNNPVSDAYDAVSSLVKEYDDLLHNALVGDFLRAEQKICRLMQQVYISISEGLELEYLDE